MADKKSNKISIKPMTNAAAIASTLGISASAVEPTIKKTTRKRVVEPVAAEFVSQLSQASTEPQTGSGGADEPQTANEKSTAARKSREAILPSETVPKANQMTTGAATSATLQPPQQMPMLIDIKRKFPGKELFVLSLLYLQRNNRGLVQMTVGNMMGLYSAVFQDVIKDDTARRSLKRLFDGGFIKTTSIPGNNSGYIYEIGDLLESENLTQAEKEEFAELTEFVKSKLNAAPV